MATMQAELNRARQQLQKTSREIARVDREVARARAGEATSRYVYRTSQRPVLGVVLGQADGAGVKVLGVSPDGPAERAGVKAGDVIVAIGGEELVAPDQVVDVKGSVSVVMKQIQAGAPVIVSLKRGDETVDLRVTPEVREPLGWHTITRFPSAPETPESPAEVISIERIVVPEIDTEALAEQIEDIRIQIDDGKLGMIVEGLPSFEGYEYRLHELSELGNLALYDANAWFGLPMTEGLKLAEVDEDLGQYFKTERGVLVLKARSDNKLQLESGDVILQVGDAEVNSPADFMRALREAEAGDELVIDIKRDRRSKTLKLTMPEKQLGYFAPGTDKKFSIHVTTESN